MKRHPGGFTRRIDKHHVDGKVDAVIFIKDKHLSIKPGFSFGIASDYRDAIDAGSDQQVRERCFTFVVEELKCLRDVLGSDLLRP